MVNSSMGPGDFDIWAPVQKPIDCMVNCSMGPGDFDIFLKPYEKPYEKP